MVSDVSSASLAEDELSTTPLHGRTLATLTSVSEDDLGEELSVVWEVEPGREIIPAGALPEVPDPDQWDAPQTLGALLDAVRGGTVASADVTTLQAPFRAGIQAAATTPPRSTKIGTRWTVSPDARFEILDRLLVENHRRAALQD